MRFLEDLLHTSAATEWLVEGGHRTAVARRLAERFAHVASALDGDAAQAAGAPPAALFVPGRIEVLGKHTDYTGGSSLTCATERGFCVVAVPGTGRTLRIVRVETGEAVQTDVQAADPPPEGHWATYPLTVVRRVAQNFNGNSTGHPLRGGTIAFSSTLPQAAGMSSSSAMVVAFFLALRAMNELTVRPRYQDHLRRPEALAQYLGAVESGQPFGPLAAQAGVGTFGGSEDHTAILCAAPGELRRFSYCPVRFEEAVALPDAYRFVVAVSGVRAEKTGGARDRYNRASQRAAAAAAAWRASTGHDDPHLGAAMRRPGFTLAQMRAALRAETTAPEPLIQRAEHFYVENQEVLPAAIEALRAADWDAFGTAVERSQRAAEQLLDNQVPETMFLARAARREGAVAASSFGAGFGGAVWALVPHDEVDRFRTAWADAYAAEFPERAEAARFFTERPGPAAFTL